ncbi:MAG: hypothetical protein AB4063_12970 [Crocosphaera sp.]
MLFYLTDLLFLATILMNSTPSISALFLDESTINEIIVYGGFCVSTILAMTIFTYVLLQGINNRHRSNQFVPRKEKNKINILFTLINRLIER